MVPSDFLRSDVAAAIWVAPPPKTGYRAIDPLFQETLCLSPKTLCQKTPCRKKLFSPILADLILR